MSTTDLVMPSLDGGRGTPRPYLSLMDVGSYVDYLIVDKVWTTRLDADGKPVFKIDERGLPVLKDGEPVAKKKLIVTAYATGTHSGAEVGTGARRQNAWEGRAPSRGAVFLVHLQGTNCYDFGSACDAFSKENGREVRVGDKVRQTFTRVDANPKGGNDRRVQSFKLRPLVLTDPDERAMAVEVLRVMEAVKSGQGDEVAEESGRNGG